MIRPGRARRRLRLAAAAGLLAAAAGSTGMCAPPEADDLMPDEVGGWSSDGDDGHYTFDTLYDLIDGGAEVYRSFGVVRVISRRYTRPDAPAILADLFDMGSPSGAYGVYHHDARDGRAAGLGDESEQAGAALALRSDRYFVSIVALEETPGSVAGVLAVARSIATRLPAGAAAPEVVRLLPEQGLLGGRVVYVRDPAYLRTRYDFGDAAPPALPPGSEGALARYRDTAGARVLMLVRYPTAAQAGAAAETFRAAWARLVKPGDTVGIKSNVWRFLPTPPELERLLRDRVLAAGVPEARIAVDDRGVLDSAVFRNATALINTRPMRTHDWAGVGSCIKNYIMFSPDPPAWHPDSCADLAGLWDLPIVKGKTRLNVLVMLTPLFHGSGPHHYQERYTWAYGGLIVGTDVVAVDATGLRILEAKRREHFGADQPFPVSPKHIRLADERHHLGVADPARIEVLRVGSMDGALI